MPTGLSSYLFLAFWKKRLETCISKKYKKRGDRTVQKKPLPNTATINNASAQREKLHYLYFLIRCHFLVGFEQNSTIIVLLCRISLSFDYNRRTYPLLNFIDSTHALCLFNSKLLSLHWNLIRQRTDIRVGELKFISARSTILFFLMQIIRKFCAFHYLTMFVDCMCM